MKKWIIGTLLLMASCMELPESVEQSLQLAGSNKGQLKKVLRHYQRTPADSLKLKAALFLIDNMKWHGNQYETFFLDSAIPDLVRHVDTLYASIQGNVPNSEMYKKEIQIKLDSLSALFQDSIPKLSFQAPVTQEISFSDLQNIKAHFLIDHIDNAFEQWRNSSFARNLSFNDFCEYLLPYRSLTNNSLTLNGKELYEQFGKHLNLSQPYTYRNVIERYNRYLNQMRNILGTKTNISAYGRYEIFFNKKSECVEQCEMECNVLRACGIPTVIDINIGNREFVGQHHHCAIIDTLGKPHPFHGESQFPKGKYWGYNADIKLNIYRSLFGAQSDSPLFLKKKEEKLPSNFQSPCIKDVTSYIKKVHSLTLPIGQKTGNNLAWLYSFSNNPEGVKAMTWGIVDSTGESAHFANVVADMLYFLATIDSTGQPEFCQEPIFVAWKPEEKEIKVYPLSHFVENESENPINLLITRKFPYKESMKKLAEEIVGGKFYGANQKDGTDQKELYTITQAPGPYLNEYRLKNKKAWKYYIYQAPENRNANISILEYLTEKAQGYPNTESPTPLEIFRPEDKEGDEKGYVKILTPKNISQEPEYDGDMQTSSSKKKIVFELDTPQIILKARIAPKNADNIIKPNENYELMVWNKGWQSLANVYSQYNYLEFPRLSSHKLYWLRNLSRGREEIPFIIHNGQPLFIYYDIMQSIPFIEFAKLDNKGWVCTASSEEPPGGPYQPGLAQLAIDNNTATFWHSQYTQQKPNYPHWIQIDTKHPCQADGFFLLPRGRDIPRNIRAEVSEDGENWKNAGFFIVDEEGVEQKFQFEKTTEFRYIRINLLDGYNAQPYTSIVEIGLFLNR